MSWVFLVDEENGGIENGVRLGGCGERIRLGEDGKVQIRSTMAKFFFFFPAYGGVSWVRAGINL